MRDVIIDTNLFILFLVGQINQNRIAQYCRNSKFTKADYLTLLEILGPFDRVITSPNILTEVDNILNRLSGVDKLRYLALVKQVYSQSLEKYLQSETVSKNWYFDVLGLTDSAILMMASESELLISADSALCDYARSLEIKVFDFMEYLNRKVRRDS
jgi:predicted nucleic acid-binding protein